MIKRKNPRQEALGNTIRKEYESTYKTVLAVYLTTSEHPARRNTVISFPYSALPLLFLFNSLVTIAMQEKSHQHCLNYSVWSLLSRSLAPPSLILHKALSPSWVPTTTPNAPLASAPQHNLIVMQDHSWNTAVSSILRLNCFHSPGHSLNPSLNWRRACEMKL